MCVCVFYMLVTVEPNVCYITRDSTRETSHVCSVLVTVEPNVCYITRDSISCETSHMCVCVCSTCWSQLNRTSVILHVTRPSCETSHMCVCVCVFYMLVTVEPNVCYITRDSTFCEASHVCVCVCWSQLNRTSVM